MFGQVKINKEERRKMVMLRDRIGFENNILYVNGKQISFEFPIEEGVIAEEIIWVQEDIPNEVYKVDNAYGVSMDGELLMRIQPPTREIYKTKNYEERMPYTGIGLSREGYYVVTDFLGMRFIFDPKTGQITGKLPSIRF